jgi:hypothetical protein
MGCGSTHIKVGGELIKQEKIELNINEHYKSKELTQAQSLIYLITTIRNKIIYEYDNLIYVSGACLFKTPTMAHCTKCILFKICSECEGDLNKANIKFKEDPPYISINSNNFSQSTNFIVSKLFEFIISLRDYKIIMKQIDKETPKLMYILFDNNNRISKDNLEKINKAILLFKDLSKLRTGILVEYKNQIYDLIMSNTNFCLPINQIGKLAIEKNIKDKYEIAFLLKQFKNDNNFMSYFKDEDMTLYKNINEAKEIMKKKLIQEKLEDDSNKENNNFGYIKLNLSNSFAATLSSSFKMYLPKS